MRAVQKPFCLYKGRYFLQRPAVDESHPQSVSVCDCRGTKMLFHCFLVVLCVLNVESVVQNVSCPIVSPRELDLKELDGKWYLAAVATDLEVSGDCAMVLFSHKSDNTTDVSISWITNSTISYYNGSVALSVDPKSNSSEGDLLMVTYTDQKAETYSFLDVDYEHYAIIFACYGNDDGNGSTYEVWELTRAPHAKPKHVSKISNALATYNLQDTKFLNFNNTEATCTVNGASLVNPSSLILTSAAAVALLRRLY